MKATANELSLINNPVSNGDLTLYIINGLSNGFETISSTFWTQDTSISFRKLYEKLVEYDNYRKRVETKSEDFTMIINTASRFSSTKNINFRHHQYCHSDDASSSHKPIFNMAASASLVSCLTNSSVPAKAGVNCAWFKITQSDSVHWYVNTRLTLLNSNLLFLVHHHHHRLIRQVLSLDHLHQIHPQLPLRCWLKGLLIIFIQIFKICPCT